MSDIKIFVSHRIDQDSVTIDNPLFYPVRCGAVFDKRKNSPDIPGDDTGDNISEKRMSYCELTVQYWAWKNADADYYGFCHYRRYFSFKSPKKQKPDMWANIPFEYFDDKAISQLDVDADFILRKMNGNPIALTTPFDVRNAQASNLYNLHRATPVLNAKDLDVLLKVIHELSPEFDNAAEEHIKGRLLYPCNMFIMKRALFFRYCEWLFPIMEECEKRIDASSYTEEEFRAIGHLAERCLGIFYTYIHNNENIKAVFFQRLFIQKPQIGVKPYPRRVDQITVVIACNNYYVVYTGVMLQSVLDNASPDKRYEIFILHKDITEESQKKIKLISRDYSNVSIKFYDISLDIASFSFKSQFPHISNETFYRLLIHKIFSNYKRILYLDSDMIIKADVAELFNIDIGDNLIGACLDQDFIGMYRSSTDSRMYAETVLKIDNPLKYFQAGVLLINIEQFRATFNDEELAEEAVLKCYRWGDQDVLNIACHGRVAFIDAEWNVMVQHQWDRLKVIKQCPFEISKRYFDARENPKIIHYAGAEKPWTSMGMDFAPDFLSVACRNVYYGELFWRMSHNLATYISNETINKKIPMFHSPRKRLAVRIASLFFPEGTKRREYLKKFYNKVRGRK
jgi:lipopolysaccharide biosynthesis glycosyltransferase